VANRIAVSCALRHFCIQQKILSLLMLVIRTQRFDTGNAIMAMLEAVEHLAKGMKPHERLNATRLLRFHAREIRRTVRVPRPARRSRPIRGDEQGKQLLLAAMSSSLH
jgi:hypothetical protein